MASRTCDSDIFDNPERTSTPATSRGEARVVPFDDSRVAGSDSTVIKNGSKLTGSRVPTLDEDMGTQETTRTAVESNHRVTFDLPVDEGTDAGIACGDTRDKTLFCINEQYIRPVDDGLWQVLRRRLKIYPFTLYYVLEYVKHDEGLSREESVYQSFWQNVLDWMKKDSVGVLVDHDEIYRSITDMVNHLKALEQNSTCQSRPWSEITSKFSICDHDDLAAFAEQTIRSGDLRGRIYSLDLLSVGRFLTTLQMLITVNCAHKRVFERFIKKIVAKTGVLPKNLFIEGVSKIGQNPLVGGGFADVYKGMFEGKSVALKVLRVFERGETDFDGLRRSFCTETIIWQKFENANVLPFYGICEDIFRPKLAMVSPWMENGDMIKYLKHNPGVDRRNLVLGVAKGLQYLHSLKPAVVHGDLRAANVIIDEDGQPRISDFGLTKVIDSQASLLLETSTSFEGRGNVRWHPPEVLHASRFNLQRCGVTKESDIYSFACVCLEIFTGKVPFSDLVDGAVIMAVGVNDQRPPRPSEPATSVGLDDDMWALIQTCWTTQPGDRTPMYEVVWRITELNATYEAPDESPMTALTGIMHDAIDDPVWSSLLVRGVQRTGDNPVTGGGFADIWRGEFRGELVALKVMRNFGGISHDIFSRIKSEAVAMQQVNHVNVLPFYGLCDDEFRPNVALVTPWMANGDLSQYLECNIDANRLGLVREVASGLSYLHGLTPILVHGDLKAANVLVDNNFRPRICDFGLSKFYDSLGSIATFSANLGTFRWAAPELLESGEDVRTAASDTYAFACLCLEVFTGAVPFREKTQFSAGFWAVLQGQRPERPTQPSERRGLDDTVWAIMTHCWAQNPENRPSADKVLRSLELHETSLRAQAELKELFK